jgi:hypothetical protein
MMSLDNTSVSTKTEILKSLEKEQLKQHIVHDAQRRPQFIFEAPIGAVEGDPCLVTEYVYIDLTESIIIDRQERVYKWKAVWDSNYTFDPTVDYDLNGDGVL